MTYKITFLKSAEKEWHNLSLEVQRQFKKKLLKIIEHPHIPKGKLGGLKDCYKIKLSSIGYRLVYKVIDERVVIQIISVGKREKSLVYATAKRRL